MTRLYRATLAFASAAILAGCAGGARFAPALRSQDIAVVARTSSQQPQPPGSPASHAGPRDVFLSLWTTDEQQNKMDVFRLTGRRMRTITSGLNDPQGVFITYHGKVLVANRGASNILEFRHYQREPYASIDDKGYLPEDVTQCYRGLIYVANYSDISGGPGNIAIYTEKKSSEVT
jgi:hypothetical protein